MSGVWLRVTRPRTRPRGVVLLLHGGMVRSRRSAWWLNVAAIRIHPLQQLLARAGRDVGLVTAQVRYNAMGWNDGERVEDGLRALAVASERWPDLPIVLVGHSMGARIALRIADSAAVVAVVGLAPWVPEGEPVAQLAGRTILLAHGTSDKTTSPVASLAYAGRAAAVTERVARFELVGAGHKMLRAGRTWHDLAIRSALAELGLVGADAGLERALALPLDERLAAPPPHR